jgi:hypothetical protein
LYIADAAEFDVESSFVDVFGVFAAVDAAVVVGSNVVLAVVVVVDDDSCSDVASTDLVTSGGKKT